MPSNGCKRKASHYNASKLADAQPGDEAVGAWPRERLLEMDESFVRAVENAIRNGSERRQSAAKHGADSTRPRYR